MRFATSPLLTVLLLLAPVWAAGTAGSDEAERETRASEDAEALANDLDRVLQEAMSQGLLSPVRPATGDPAGRDEGVPGSPPTQPQAAVDVPPILPRARVDCGQPFPLDFDGYQGLTRYQEIYDFRANPDAPEAQSDSLGQAMLAKAYLALGLTAEALMTLGDDDSPRAMALRKAARLVEGKSAPDTDFFREFAACHERGRLWLALALLSEGEADGAALLNANLGDFRQLPLRLRIEAAALAVPKLDALSEPVISQKMMADFTPEEIESSAELQFKLALARLNSGEDAAEEVVRGFLNQPPYQEEALAAMLRRGHDVEMGDPEIMLDGLMTQIRKAERDEDVAATVSFALKTFSARAEYDRILELARMPVLQRKPVQDMIRLHAVAAFRRDLTSDDPLRNLTAIRALASQEAALLDEADDRDGYFDLAAARAERFGFPSLAADLAARIDDEAGGARYTAERAYRAGEYETVFAMARRNTEDDRIALLAALGAVRTGDGAAVSDFLPRISQDPANVLRLIEADADSGHWVLPEAWFETATRLEAPAQRQRVARVLAMRDGARGRQEAPSEMSIAEIGDALARSEAVLNTLGKETF